MNMGAGSRSILNKQTGETYLLWKKAGGESLPQFRPISFHQCELNITETHKVEHKDDQLSGDKESALEEQLKNLEELALLHVAKMHSFGNRVGNRNIGDILDHGSPQDILITKCALIINKYDLDLELLKSLIHRVHIQASDVDLPKSTNWYKEGERKARWWLEEVGPYLGQPLRDVPEWARYLITEGWKVVPRTKKVWLEDLAKLRG